MGARPPKESTTDGIIGRNGTQETGDTPRPADPAAGNGVAPPDGTAPAHTPDGLSAEQRECIEALVREAAQKGWRQKALLRRVREAVRDSPAAETLAMRLYAEPLVPGVPRAEAGGRNGVPTSAPGPADAPAPSRNGRHTLAAHAEAAADGAAPVPPSPAASNGPPIPATGNTDPAASPAGRNGVGRNGAAHPPLNGVPRTGAAPQPAEAPPEEPADAAGDGAGEADVAGEAPADETPAGEAPTPTAPPESEEAQFKAACEAGAQKCIIDGRLAPALVNTEAAGIAQGFGWSVDRVRQGMEAAYQQRSAADAASPAARARDWTALSPEEQDRIVAAVAAEAPAQQTTSKGPLLALARGIVAKECPDLRYNQKVGGLIAGRVLRRLKEAEEEAAPAATGRKALGPEDLERIVADLVPVAGNDFEMQKRLLRWEGEYGGRLPKALREEAKRRAQQAAQAATDAEAKTAAQQAAPVIDLACSQAADTLRDLLAAAEALPQQQRWPNPALQALDAVRGAATVAWQTQPGHAGDALPPHHLVANILKHPTLAPLVERLEAAFGPRWSKALGGKALRDLLPGCPADIVLDEDCRWHVQPDGSVTRMVLADDGQGGKASREECVLPAVAVPLEQEWSLSPWGLPATASVMMGQQYAWWHRTGDGGRWETGQRPASVLWDTRRLLTLADDGVPIDSHNASEYLSFLAYVRDCAPAARRPVFAQPGFHELPGGSLVFALGSTVVTANGLRDAALAERGGDQFAARWHRGVDEGAKQYLAAFHHKGSDKESARLFLRHARGNPRIAAMAGMAYAALLLPLLKRTGAITDMAGFIVECSAPKTNIGKSTAQRLVMSLVGNPNGGLIRAFNRTAVSTGNLLASAHGMPCALEETQTAGAANRDTDGATLKTILYMVAQGMDKERGAATGGSRETRFWNSVLFLTGEAGLAGLAKAEDTGAERRIILVAPPFAWGADTAKVIKDEIEPTMARHYGHVVPVVLQGLLREAERLGGFDALAEALSLQHINERKALEQAFRSLHPEARDETVARLSRFGSMVAAGMMALRFIVQACGETADSANCLVDAARRVLIEDNAGVLGSLGQDRRYFAALKEVIAQNTARISGTEPRGRDGQPEVPRQGYIGGVGSVYGQEVIGIFPLALKDLITRALGQYNGRTFVQAMEDLGVLVPDPKYPGRAASLRYQRADGQTVTHRHLCFRRDAVLPCSDAPGEP